VSVLTGPVFVQFCVSPVLFGSDIFRTDVKNCESRLQRDCPTMRRYGNFHWDTCMCKTTWHMAKTTPQVPRAPHFLTNLNLACSKTFRLRQCGFKIAAFCCLLPQDLSFTDKSVEPLPSKWKSTLPNYLPCPLYALCPFSKKMWIRTPDSCKR